MLEISEETKNQLKKNVPGENTEERIIYVVSKARSPS